MSKPSIRCGRLRKPELPAELLGHDLAPARSGEEVRLEGEGRVLLRHGDELALPPALGDQELHASLAELGQPLPEQRLLRDLGREQDLARRHHALRVELPQQRREELAVGGAAELVQEERLAAEQAAAAHEEDLDARLGPLARQAQDVLVLRLDRDDLLALADRVQRLDLVAEDAGPLELLLRGGLLHLGGQASGQVLVPALEEGLDVLHRPGVPLARLPPRARGVAPVDVVLEARALGLPVDLDAAGPEREQRPHQAEGLAKGGRRVERAVVGRAVLLDPPGDQETRELLVRRQLQEGVVLVVPQDDVVAGPVPLDQVRLEDQGLELVGRDDVVEVGDVVDQRVGLRVARAGGLEVGADAGPDGRRLADVDHLPLGVLVEVDARPVREALELLREIHGSIVRSTARGRAGQAAGVW